MSRKPAGKWLPGGRACGGIPDRPNAPWPAVVGANHDAGEQVARATAALFVVARPTGSIVVALRALDLSRLRRTGRECASRMSCPVARARDLSFGPLLPARNTSSRPARRWPCATNRMMTMASNLESRLAPLEREPATQHARAHAPVLEVCFTALVNTCQ